MTASLPSPVDDDAAEPDGSGPDFRLVESAAGWQLTVVLSDELRRALADETDEAEDGPASTFMVSVAPNLVPGEPFKAVLDVRRR
jgi:hypothetical protein